MNDSEQMREKELPYTAFYRFTRNNILLNLQSIISTQGGNIMKKNVVLFFMILCLVLSYCGGGGGQQFETAPQAYDMVIMNEENKQDDLTYLYLKVTKLAVTTDSADALVIIINNLDRAIKADFDGASHYTETVGDRQEKKVTISTGSYMLISAPGLNFTPPKSEVYLAGNTKYVVELTRQKERVEYDR
jgi:hypothetical protein